MSEASVSSTVAGAHIGYGYTAAKERQLMERKTSGSARKVQKGDERWTALWPNWNDVDTLGDRCGELVESGFAQVLKSGGLLLGLTSNDAPELKKANVGIAVEGAPVYRKAPSQSFSPAGVFQVSQEPLTCRGRSSNG